MNTTPTMLARILKQNADLMDRAGGVASGYGEYGLANACWAFETELRKRATAERARAREELPIRWANEATVVAAVRTRLKERGMTQAAVADDLGITQKHLSQVLSGKAGASLGLLVELLAVVDLALTVDEF